MNVRDSILFDFFLPNIQITLNRPAIPHFLKIYSSTGRVERQLAGLRCAQGIHLHVLTHAGKLPETLAEITDVALPVDPFTGESMEAWYSVVGARAILEVPPPPESPLPRLGRRYEIRVSLKQAR